ncbi:signal recognition particle-docking protein FtsY [Acetobacteraceae bacterium]|nr:signal recognition particle-docking protein FtsY [Acetobacteraceae bacterium]
MSSFFGKIKKGLSRSTQKFTEILTGTKIDDETLEELEDELIAADLGPETAARAIEKFRSKVTHGATLSAEQLQESLAEVLAETLEPLEAPFTLQEDKKPHVILMVGVNGTGKTTTSGKIAAQFALEGEKVFLAAADTFRAAAVEQLQTWGERANVPVITGKMGGDPASVAYDALDQATKAKADLLIIDTAGRLHNKNTLMEELAKMIRVLKKIDPDAPHSVLLTLDAVTGQNALDQVKIFRELVRVTGLIITKIDGTARGGIVAALAHVENPVPVHFVGFGEKLEDLRPFKADLYAKGLVGLDENPKTTEDAEAPLEAIAATIENDKSTHPKENLAEENIPPASPAVESTDKTATKEKQQQKETSPEDSLPKPKNTEEQLVETQQEKTEEPIKKKGFFHSWFSKS